MIPASLEQKFFHTQGILSHHQARLQLVQNTLPPAQLILDLGIFILPPMSKAIKKRSLFALLIWRV
jgi:hypothetical protein